MAAVGGGGWQLRTRRAERRGCAAPGVCPVVVGGGGGKTETGKSPRAGGPGTRPQTGPEGVSGRFGGGGGIREPGRAAGAVGPGPWPQRGPEEARPWPQRAVPVADPVPLGDPAVPSVTVLPSRTCSFCSASCPARPASCSGPALAPRHAHRAGKAPGPALVGWGRDIPLVPKGCPLSWGDAVDALNPPPPNPLLYAKGVLPSSRPTLGGS